MNAQPECAQVAELVDALASGASAARCAGSSPVLGTILRLWLRVAYATRCVSLAFAALQRDYVTESSNFSCPWMIYIRSINRECEKNNVDGRTG
jgi:hypothetical protein